MGRSPRRGSTGSAKPTGGRALARDPGRSAQLGGVLYSLAESLRLAAAALTPFLVETPERIYQQLGLDPALGRTASWEEATRWGDGLEYDSEHHGCEPAGPFYESLAARTGGPVLDLACGTGRIAIPLAQRGYAVTGADLAPAMLDAAPATRCGRPASPRYGAFDRSPLTGESPRMIYVCRRRP